jgi:hypothetical protein
VRLLTYERLLNEAAKLGIYTYEKPLIHTTKGLYSDNVILINQTIPTNVEKACILAEELGHYHTSTGNIIDQTKLSNRKQEYRALHWAYERLVPLSSIVQAHKSGIRNRHELAVQLNVTEEFLESALKRYQEKYGLMVSVGNYTVSFEPLGIIEMFEF